MKDQSKAKFAGWKAILDVEPDAPIQPCESEVRVAAESLGMRWVRRKHLPGEFLTERFEEGDL